MSQSSSKVTVRQVQNLSESEIEQATAVWEQAFKNDEFVKVCSGGSEAFFKRFIFSTLLAAIKGGEVYFASYEDVPVAGVAAWFPPGHGLLHEPEQGDGGFNELFADFPPELTQWWMEYFLPKYEKHTTEALGEGFKLNSWHLQFIGTRPEFQHHGIGSALIDAVDQKAKAEGKSLVLEVEVEKTIAFYQKNGFSIKGAKEEYENPIKGFPMWVLVKDHAQA